MWEYSIGIIFTIIKKMWHAILDAIAWLTQDSSRITKRKRRREMDYIRLRGIRKM